MRVRDDEKMRSAASPGGATVTVHDAVLLAPAEPKVSVGKPEVSDYSLTIDAAGTHQLHHPESGWALALS